MSETALQKYETQSIEQIWHNPAEIKALVAPKLTDTEFAYFMGMSKATGMNPLTREIWAVKYGDYAAQIFIGRDGYRRRAQELPEYEGHSKGAIYENDEFEVVNGIPHHRYKLTNRGKVVGAYCVVYISGRKIPFMEVVDFHEYFKPGKNEKPTTWDTMPATMIQKVAEAQALRGAFQGIFAGTYSEAERWDERQSQPQTQVYQEDIDLYGEETSQQPKKTPDSQREALYNAIETLTLDRHPKHAQASLKKYLNVSDLHECKNVRKLYEYYQHVVKTQSEFIGNTLEENAEDLFLSLCEQKNFEGALNVYRRAASVQE